MEFFRYSLDNTTKDMLLTELKDKPFIQKSLAKLINNKYYYLLKQNNIELYYLYVSYKKIKTVFQRLLTTAKQLTITNKITIWFIPCKEKRFFPKTEPICAKHINGGYTYTSDNTIFIYRLEEFPKVMLHELIHNSKLNTDIPQHLELELYTDFSIDKTNCDTTCNTQLRINEAVVEAWAILYHLKYIASEYHKSFESLLQEELDWSLYLCKKLLNHQQNNFKKWKEETHSYSYIRLKTCILFFLKEFLKLEIPYQPRELISFFQKKNNRPRFIKAIKNAKDFNTNKFCMTVNGND